MCCGCINQSEDPEPEDPEDPEDPEPVDPEILKPYIDAAAEAASDAKTLADQAEIDKGIIDTSISDH